LTDPRSPGGAPAAAPDRLDSWKDIAAYLKRDVSTVQRWEKREGMPVHRHLHDKLGSVYAYPAELDEWSRSRRSSETPRVDGSQDAVAPPVVRRRWPVAVVIVAGVLIAVAIVAIRSWRERVATDASPSNPIASARFVPLTDFEGRELAATISRDGRFVAFISDRDGPVDVWLTQVGSGQFRNLTGGRLRELVNPDVRMLGFSPDNTFVAIWVRLPPGRPSDISIWSVATLGGEPRLLLEGAAELDWSRDGSRLVYHTPAPGDPMFVRDAAGGQPRALFTAAPGIHNHYPVWSPDDAFIYYVGGAVPVHQDVWRIAVSGGAPERMTSHGTRVSHLAFLDANTLVYLATDEDGSGPWLYALDVERRETRRISSGVERYESIAASADGRRLAVSVANSRRTLWRVPIGENASAESAAEKIPLAVVGGRAPRAGPGYLLYVSSRSGGESLWKFAGGTATELWSVPDARIVGGPAISPDGKRVAFTAEQKNGLRLYVMNADGSGLRPIAEALAVRGAPAWSPDGASLAIAAEERGVAVLMTVGVANGRASVLRRETASDPVWAPDGASILYSGAEVGTTFPIRRTGLDGRLLAGREIVLSRGVRRIAFLPGKNAIVVLRGDMVHKNFWSIDLDTGRERQLTDFGRNVVVGGFDISPDGREILFDREQDTSDIVLIER
jgi:Tol biopolymer transport system component